MSESPKKYLRPKEEFSTTCLSLPNSLSCIIFTVFVLKTIDHLKDYYVFSSKFCKFFFKSGCINSKAASKISSNADNKLFTPGF